MTSDTSNTTQADHGDPEDPNTYGLCRCCEVRPVALPSDDLCPTCEKKEFGATRFVVHEFDPWDGPRKEFDHLNDAVAWQEEAAPNWGITMVLAQFVALREPEVA